MKDLKVALIQADLIWENPKRNKEYFLEKIHLISEEVDLVVLPEMFTTGFTMNPYDVAETTNGETTTWLIDLAKEKNSAIVGSLIIKEGVHYYNRLLFVYPTGEIKAYDKRHTFTLAGEHKVYTAGTEKLIVAYNGWKICPLICYDLRFPVWARNTENYDVLIYVANWPKARIAAWDTLLKARAIENMSYSIGVNRVGVDPNGYEYTGHSAVYNCLGAPISSIEASAQKTEIITLSAEHLKETRNTLRFLNDKDTFTLSS